MEPRRAATEFVGFLPGDLQNLADLTFADDLFQGQESRLISHGQQHPERDPVALDGFADLGKTR